MNESSATAVFPDWKAPAAEGEILISPQARQILAHTAENHRRLSSDQKTTLSSVPLAEVRKRMRRVADIAEDELAIFSGHQTELYHCGVWAKDALTTSAAAKMPGAAAWRLAVDTDQPKHLTLRWPFGSLPITDDPRINSAAWSGLLNGPTSEHLQQLQIEYSNAASGWGFEPLAGRFLQEFPDGSLSSALTAGIANLNQDLGLADRPILISSLLDCAPYLLFAWHFLSDAAGMAKAYNQALADFRKINKVRSPTRPMPDLVLTEDLCEIPFWLDDLATGNRRRAALERVSADKWGLNAGGDVLHCCEVRAWEAAEKLQSFLREHNLRLSPRALTLTLFVRLLLADQFVHGIGGGRYDRVTDALIVSRFHIAPPAFCVTTATLFFPSAAQRDRVCIPCLKQEGHRLSHSILGDEKMEMVRRIGALPRNSADRQLLFGQMHGRLAAAGLDHPDLRRWQEKWEEAQLQSQWEQTLFDRELFFALQPRTRLVELLGKYQAEFAG